MIMSMNRLRGTTFVFPDLGSPNWILRIADIMLFRLWKHIFTFTLISCTVKSGLWVGDNGKCNVIWHVYARVLRVSRKRRVNHVIVTTTNRSIDCFASSELGSNRARVSRRACICCVLEYTRVGCTGVARASPSCVRAFALHALRTRYAISWLHVMIASS